MQELARQTLGPAAESRAAPTKAVIRERRPVLRRILRALADSHLLALIAGLDAHCDDLVAGRLFDSRGGCVVGVMLQELHPAKYGHGRLHYLLRERWRRSITSDWDFTREFPRLAHLELCFDLTAQMIRRERPQLTDREAATQAGRWFLTEARRELASRRGATIGPLKGLRSGRNGDAPAALQRQAKDLHAA